MPDAEAEDRPWRCAKAGLLRADIAERGEVLAERRELVQAHAFGGLDLVSGRAGFGLDRDVLGLAAYAELVDARACVDTAL